MRKVNNTQRHAGRIAWTSPCVTCCVHSDDVRTSMLWTLQAVHDGTVDDLDGFLDHFDRLLRETALDRLEARLESTSDAEAVR